MDSYLASDMDAAVDAAVAAGAVRLVDTFPDPIGRDTIIQWPGGVNTQLYRHRLESKHERGMPGPEGGIADLDRALGGAVLRLRKDGVFAADAGGPTTPHRRRRRTGCVTASTAAR